MIDVTRLYCGASAAGELPQSSTERKPVVVWECTRRRSPGRLGSEAGERPSTNELRTDEARAMVQDLALLGVPALLIAGGEPLLREDIFDLARLADGLGVRPALFTDGTLLSRDVARDLKRYGFGYVEIALEGVGAEHDRLWGKKGAFDEALEGFRWCVRAGQRVGLGLALTRHSAPDLEAFLQLIEEEKAGRACFYHPVYARGDGRRREDALAHDETRRVVDTILDRAADFHRRGQEKRILTADNHTDGVYLYQRMVRERSERAPEVLSLLKWDGGNRAGMDAGAIDDEGNVHADRFWRHHSFGSVRERPFSRIWMDTSDPIMAGLRNRAPLLQGRCGACRYQDICNGNSRVRAEAVHGDVWAEDPACYL